jgi:plasmid stabilization system protein ParE
MRSLLIRPDAEVDIEEAYRWYERQRSGLGSDFLLCLEEGFAKTQKNPEMFPVVHRNVRRLLIRRFPYGIFYISGPSLTKVLAVLHLVDWIQAQ